MLEVLLTMALLAILAGFSMPVAYQWLHYNEADIAAATIAQNLRRAQALSRANDGDASWGVAVDPSDNDQIILFQGSSYATRTTAFDEAFDLSPIITVSGVSEVVFDQLTGETADTGTITLTTVNSQTRAITVNAYGAVGY